MQTLTVQQPWASAIVAGLKRVENRTWETEHRGWMFIHSAKTGANIGEIDDAILFPVISDIVRNFSQSEEKWVGKSRYYDENWDLLAPLTPEEDREEEWLCRMGDGLEFGAVVGAAYLEEIVENSEDRFAIKGQKHWILTDFVEFPLPHTAVNGRLRMWEFNPELLSSENQEILRQAMERKK